MSDELKDFLARADQTDWTRLAGSGAQARRAGVHRRRTRRGAGAAGVLALAGVVATTTGAVHLPRQPGRPGPALSSSRPAGYSCAGVGDGHGLMATPPEPARLPAGVSPLRLVDLGSGWTAGMSGQSSVVDLDGDFMLHPDAEHPGLSVLQQINPVPAATADRMYVDWLKGDVCQTLRPGEGATSLDVWSDRGTKRWAAMTENVPVTGSYPRTAAGGRERRFPSQWALLVRNGAVLSRLDIMFIPSSGGRGDIGRWRQWLAALAEAVQVRLGGGRPDPLPALRLHDGTVPPAAHGSG